MKLCKKIITWLSAICLVFLAFLLTISFLLKWNLRENEISTYLKDNDLSFILKNVDGTENHFIKDTKGLLELIGIPKETIENVLNSEATKEFLAKYLTDILQFLIYDKENTSITSEDIVTLAEANFRVIEETLNAKGLTFDVREKEKIYALVEENADRVMYFFPTADMVLGEIDQSNIPIYKDITLKEVTEFTRLMTSDKMILTFLVLIALGVFLIFICNFKKRHTWFYLKISTFTYALLFIIIEVLLGTVIKKELMLKIVSAKEFVNYMINTLSKNIWIFILIALFLSLIFAKLQKGRKNHAPILDQLYKEDKNASGKENNEK